MNRRELCKTLVFAPFGKALARLVSGDAEVLSYAQREERAAQRIADWRKQIGREANDLSYVCDAELVGWAEKVGLTAQDLESFDSEEEILEAIEQRASWLEKRLETLV